MKKLRPLILDSFPDLRNQKYVNRELSWLEFNKRVLYQCTRKSIPLIERFKFLAITDSNLNEFIMVRLASVVNRMMRNKKENDISGMPPDIEYEVLLDQIKKFKDLQLKVYTELTSLLKDEDIPNIVKYDTLNKSEKHIMSKMFYDKIYPLLVPINYSATTEFPDLKSKQNHVVVSLDNGEENTISFVPIPDNIDKLYTISTKSGDKTLFLEDIVCSYLDKIYIGKTVNEYGVVRILRNCDIEVDHNKSIYIVDRMMSILHQREKSSPLFIDTNGLSKNMIKWLCDMFKVSKQNVFSNSVDYTALFSLPKNSKHVYEEFNPQYPSELVNTNMFNAIKQGDIILHHPYDSFAPVIQFLEQAAYDENVLSIKQTLYRVSSVNSPIVNALCIAASNGKQVTVMLELKARFDEGQNISIITKLKSSGCTIVYGIEELKTHAKLILITRKEKGKLKLYSHIGTGNYNDKTASIYTDISYFTSDFKTGEDITTIFNMVSGFSEPNNKINRIFFSPYNLRKRLYTMIDNEIKIVEKGGHGTIILKMNSISDKEFIDKLYRASKKGVRVVIFCRGICSMKPINKNIFIRSLVGRYLEHSRIYYFSNNNDPEVFISSADLLTRNLDKRVELLFPVKNKDAKDKLIKTLLLYYKDNVNTFAMDKDGVYSRLSYGKKDFNIHNKFMTDAIETKEAIGIPKMIKYMKNNK